MAETRKFDGNASEGIQRQVREALGEIVRPVEPGRSGDRPAREAAPVVDDPTEDLPPGYLFYGPSDQ